MDQACARCGNSARGRPESRGSGGNRGRRYIMRTRTHAPRGRVCLALLSIISIAIFALAGQASAGINEASPLPAISSDKPDYAPGEQVTLSGNYWAAGESVHVVVNDDAGQTWRHEADVVA